MTRNIVAGNGHKLGYIHIPCTGGRSVAQALGLLPSHATAALMRKHADITGTFTVVRSPFTLAVSWYNRLHHHDENVEAFRPWLAAGADVKDIPLVNGGTASPLSQLDWIDETTVVFCYPDLQAAADWAAHICGKPRRRVGRHGTWPKTVEWWEYYDSATTRMVERRWADVLARFAFHATELP